MEIDSTECATPMKVDSEHPIKTDYNHDGYLKQPKIQTEKIPAQVNNPEESLLNPVTIRKPVKRYFLKFQALGEGSFWIEQLPCLVGTKKGNSPYGSPLGMSQEQEKAWAIKLMLKDSKYCVSPDEIQAITPLKTCHSRSGQYEFALAFDEKENAIKILAYHEIVLNGKKKTFDHGFIELDHLDKLHIPCISNQQCPMPHFYHVIFPELPRDPIQQVTSQFQPSFRDLYLPQNRTFSLLDYRSPLVQPKPIDNWKRYLTEPIQSERRLVSIGEWTPAERESLKRFILIYGYGRWTQIREAAKNAGYNLDDKSDEEMTLNANAFLCAIIDQIPQGTESKELKQFLQSLVDNNMQEGTKIESNAQQWGGDILFQRTNQWAKRIQMLYIANRIVQVYKQKKKEYFKQDSHKIDNRVIRSYKSRENLLNFIPNDQLLGIRPAHWWTRKHDIDLMFGTFKWGYGNYNMLRDDPKLSFSKLKPNDSYYAFPQAENLTRRLKKLAQLISRVDGNFDFESGIKASEPSGFIGEEKDAIIQVIGDIGVPYCQDDINKPDWQLFKLKVQNYLQRPMNQSEQKFEKFINYLQLESEKACMEYKAIVGTDDNAVDPDDSEEASLYKNEFRVQKTKKLRIDEFPQIAELSFKIDDDDTFYVTIENSFLIQKRILLFNVIRKLILVNDSRLFDAHTEELMKLLDDDEHRSLFKLPSDWVAGMNDRGLLNAVSEQGINFLKNVKYSQEYGLNACRVNQKRLLRRVEFLCHFFKNISMAKKKQDGGNINQICNNIPIKASQMLIEVNRQLRIKFQSQWDYLSKYTQWIYKLLWLIRPQLSTQQLLKKALRAWWCFEQKFGLIIKQSWLCIAS